MYFMPASLAMLDPLVGVELHRVELLGVVGVLGHGDLAAVHDPLADAADLLAVVGAGGHGVDAPVDEHAEAGLAPPFHAGVALGRGFRVLGLCSAAAAGMGMADRTAARAKIHAPQ